jgi:hypothetical protein
MFQSTSGAILERAVELSQLPEDIEIVLSGTKVKNVRLAHV